LAPKALTLLHALRCLRGTERRTVSLS